jgi:pimeloyl-ACP methyl ester carboxylesterase
MSIRRGYVDTDWGQLHYAQTGQGPPCVFFHESPQSLRAYETALPFMADRLTAIAIDTPGYGNSDPPPNDQFEIPDYAAHILKGIDELGVDRFAVSGVHTGASIAIEVARQAGMDRITHAVLTREPLLNEEERATYLAGWSPKMEPDSEGSHLRWAWERYQRVWGADSDASILHLASTQILNVLDRYEWAYNAAFRYDPAPTLPELTCPVLLLDAENDLLAEYDEPTAALLSNARIEIVPGLGGQLPIRVPEIYANAVAEFITDS